MQDQNDAPPVSKRTVIIGASDNPSRYSFLATSKLLEHGYEAIPLGIRQGSIDGTKIENLAEKPTLSNVDTVTLYLNPTNQKQWQEYILSLKPKRIIFNPGTENQEFETSANSKGIETLRACTLVMLSIGNY